MKIIRFSSDKTIIIRTNSVKFQRVIITFTVLFTPVIFVKYVSSMQNFIEHVEEFLKLCHLKEPVNSSYTIREEMPAQQYYFNY